MDGLQGGTKVNEGATQQPKPQDDQAQQAALQVTGAGAGEGGGKAGVAGGSTAGGDTVGGADGAASDGAVTGAGDAAKARANYEVALKERDAKIKELEGEIAEAAKTAESAERLRAEMDELRRKGDEERVGFGLQLAGARNVKAARALLADYKGDVEKLKAGEPWLFGAGAAASEQTGATGLPNAGAATDEGAQMRRWRGIAGLPEDKE